MIPKIICWIFGHKRGEWVWNGKYSTMNHDIDTRCPPEPIYEYRKFKNCLRCGVKL